MAAIMTGTVKSVLSGDTIILRGKPTNGPPPERQLNLAFIVAPRLATKTTQDEPFAWESREFLRKKIIGQEVKFNVLYKNQSGREFGQVFLGEENINNLVLSKGWVSIKEIKGEVNEELVAIQTTAKDAGLGMWGKEGTKTIRKINWSIEDTSAYFEKSKGKTFNAVVERVRDGSTYQLTLLPSFDQVTLFLSGIKCPIYRKDVPDQPDLIEPFAAEAKYFAETRVLNQDVKVVIEGSSNKNLIGSVTSSKGNMAELLLREGLAKIVDWSITMASAGPQSLRDAEKSAKDKKVKLWQSYKEQDSSVGSKEFNAKIVKIVNGEQIIVQLGNKEEKKITLSSIRQLKGKEPKDLFLQSEAKEFLRKHYIGKKVTVRIDFIKPAEGQFEEKVCGTITIGKINISEELVKTGLVGVIKHKQDDHNRSPIYDILRIAEEQAEKSKIGIFDTKEIQIPKIGDLSENAAKAKQFAPRLQRQGKISAVVEHIFNGSRMKIYIPKELTKATFVLSGVYCGKVEKNDPSKNEPFAQEALDFSQERCLQYDVDIEVEGADKVGCLIGSMFLRSGENLSLLLLEEGLATANAQSAEQSNYVNLYYAAETRAKGLKKNIWKLYSQEQEKAQKKETESGSKTEYLNIKLGTVLGKGQFIGKIDGQSQLNTLFEELNLNSSSSEPAKLQKGDLCLVRNPKLERARVMKMSPKEVEVYYIDRGTSENVSPNKIEAMPSKLSSVPPLAYECVLSGLKFSDDEDYEIESSNLLMELTKGKSLVGEVVGRVDKVIQLILYDSSSLSSSPSIADVTKSINYKIVESGLALLDKRNKKISKLVELLRPAQEFAKSKRLMMWRYGDISDDEANEFGTNEKGKTKK